MSPVELKPLTGAELQRALPDLARLRIEVFRDFPYLYDGSTDYEERYLAAYGTTERAIIVGAFDGDRVVGAATALPLAAEPARLTEPLARAGYDVGRLFYFGESVLQRSYRGQGIGVRFFAAREAHARGFGTYTHAAFCGVVRPDDHPARPAGYVPLDTFWQRRGYRRLDGVLGSISWRDLGAAEESAKPMQFWIKPL
jgi:GNAT superfamily N-acetyltransferase